MIFELENVTQFRDRKAVLKNISFRQPHNVSIGIMGARGAGKTTLIELVLGAVPPDHGRLRRGGRVSMPIGFPATLHRLLSGKEIVFITAGLYGADPRALYRFVAEYGELGSALRKPFGEFNSMERSRFVFSLSYGLPADCYVADGTLFGGDPGFRDRCLELAKTRRREAAMFFTTQSPRDMRIFADVGAVLANGALTFYPSVNEAIAAFSGDTASETDIGELDEVDDESAESQEVTIGP